MKNKKIVIASLIIVITIIGVLIFLIFNKETKNDTENQANDEEPVGVLVKNSEKSAEGSAHDALSTALSSLYAEYYTSDGADEDSLVEMVTQDKLSELIPDYELTVESRKNGLTIIMKDKNYTFVAEITEKLTISSFEIKK